MWEQRNREAERNLLRKGHLGADRLAGITQAVGEQVPRCLRAFVLLSIDETAHTGLALHKYEIHIVARLSSC